MSQSQRASHAAPTKLILGGVTEHGHRAASDLCRTWIAEGANVIWFDGWPDGIRPDIPSGDLEVISYGEREIRRLSNRLEAWLGRAAPEMGGGLRSRLAVLARRWNTATRGYLSWRTIQGDMRRMAEEVDVEEVAYCDEHAATAAWHAARLWPAARVRRA